MTCSDAPNNHWFGISFLPCIKNLFYHKSTSEGSWSITNSLMDCDRSKPKLTSGLELRGQWGSGHLRIGIFEKWVTLEVSKNCLCKAIFSTFLDILCITIHFRAIKSSVFTKIGEVLLTHPIF